MREDHRRSAPTTSARRTAATNVKIHNLEVREGPPPSEEPASSPDSRIAIDPDEAANGIARLVLTLIKFLHELMQRQALRRMDKGTLSPTQVEKLGVALMKQAEELERLRREFGLEEEELNLDLGPLGRLV